eukprot:CAMPEP_0194101696 /NCGR_PEP_ID=MMETSP0150-20130528/2390_1 /TAXON_ID=122233 /ORGANISM="Chaetoceros debilis, Strain MM31A-1" /LENGTH=252 /DNA_ID=CAMNT_0038788397 /DNA_START=123 /DNA_END=881 /DNA_ORIENTATION=+
MSIDKDESILKGEVANEVQALLAKAKAIRESLPEEKKPEVGEMQVDGAATSVADEIDDAVGYRLYIDIGREDGTWMDPKWGASGKRIETSIDVSFLLPQSDINMDDTSLAGENIVSQMVKDNLSGKSSAVRILNTLTGARLRGGFDQMNCNGGGYRIDAGNGRRSSSSTARFFIEVDGTEGEKSNGDIFIPKGRLYFSLPCFGNSLRQLSTREGIITVRQMGWHTGWRREESRIIGVFRAVSIGQAKKRDSY